MKRKLNKYCRLLIELVIEKASFLITKCTFYIKGVECEGFRTLGIPDVRMNENSRFNIGSDFVMVNLSKIATLGRCNRCLFNIYDDAILKIGDRVAMSNVTIVSTMQIQIGNNVIIGGGTTIVDSDFHSMDPKHWHSDMDSKCMNSKPICISDNVFIGMDVIILKGVNLGANCIISAGSVIVKDVPENEVWGGNPAKFIKRRY